MKNKIIVITGGATGIGKALAHKLAQAGMRVTIASTNGERLAAAAGEMGKEGLPIEAAVCAPA